MATDMHYGAAKRIFKYAELLRKNMIPSEAIVWERLNNNQLDVRIRKQHPIWKYIADFYFHKLKLIIEIEGGIHLLKEYKEYDIGREVYLNEFGIEIIRFTNEEVTSDIESVIQKN